MVHWKTERSGLKYRYWLIIYDSCSVLGPGFPARKNDSKLTSWISEEPLINSSLVRQMKAPLITFLKLDPLTRADEHFITCGFSFFSSLLIRTKRAKLTSRWMSGWLESFQYVLKNGYPSCQANSTNALVGYYLPRKQCTSFCKLVKTPTKGFLKKTSL